MLLVNRWEFPAGPVGLVGLPHRGVIDSYLVVCGGGGVGSANGA